jgi:hypothetical protein
MRKLMFLAACALAAIALPTGATADATQTVETWTNQPTDLFYAGEFCGGRTVAGYGLESGIARTTETSNGGSHVRGHAEGSVPLYEASGPPWDVTFGAYVGTWTYSINFDEQVPPGGQASLGSTSGGDVVYADGTVAHYEVAFRLVFSQNGTPKLFFAQVSCGSAK